MDINTTGSEIVNPNNGAMQINSNSIAAFVPTPIEKISILASYAIAYLYTYILLSPNGNTNICLVIFTLCFCVGAELVYHKQKAVWESYIWLGCLLICLVCYVVGRDRIWGDYTLLFLHAYAIYWVLARSGRMMDKESSGFILLDVINGVLIFPFKNFFLRFRVIWSSLKEKSKSNSSIVIKVITIIAVVFVVILFCLAVLLLSSADQLFGRAFYSVTKYLQVDIFREILIRFIISLPIGAYLYGLVIGTNREEPEKLLEHKNAVLNGLEYIKKVPSNIWTVLLGVFSVLYLIFFIFQGSYLFGAFAHKLPETFTVAQYARQGFFELCVIMALNFILLWLAVMSSNTGIHRNKTLKVMCTVLLIESILFSVTALSKIFLYISNFGFTPLRFQSTWLVCVLLVGCIASIYTIWTGRRSAKTWILYSGITLALLHIY